MFDIDSIYNGLIDRRESYRADSMWSVYNGTVIAINNSFNKTKIDKLPDVRIRPKTLEKQRKEKINKLKMLP